MNAAVGIARAYGGIATRAQMIEHGASPGDIADAVRHGALERLRRGHYAARNAPAPARLAVTVGGRLAGVSAAATYGLWAGVDARIHVAVPPNASRLRSPPAAAPIVLHWIDHVIGPHCWRTTPEDTLRHVVRWSETETAIACLDTAMETWRWTSADLQRIFAGRPAADRLLAWRARPGSGSGCESIVRQRLLAMGVRVAQQVNIAGVGRVDMMVPRTRLVIEIDGFEHHGTRRAFEEDRRRDAELARRGYVVVRLTYRQITSDWARCRGALLAALSEFRNG
ncbi:MAG: DUF559 domain-containing protein [Pseudolysinimonas sp.]